MGPESEVSSHLLMAIVPHLNSHNSKPHVDMYSTTKRAGLGLALPFLFLMATPGSAVAQIGLPTAQQPGQADCGPTALASVTRWLQQNGLPELGTRAGGTALADFRDQLKQDAKTDAKGTWNTRLAQAFNRIIADSPYSGRLCAQLATGAGLRDFSGMDGWLADGCQQVVLLQHENEKDNHFVGLNNLTAVGVNRSLEYMDPSTGTMRTMALTMVGGRMTFMRNGKAGWVGGVIVICPKNHTKSSKVPVMGGSPMLRFEPFFLPTRKCKDLHIKVRDGNQVNYQVAGLPQGWSWTVHSVNGQNYLSFYQNGSATDLESGQDIDVTYTGFGVYRKRRKVINQTTTGMLNPAAGALPPESGWTIAFASFEAPAAPENMYCALGAIAAGEFDLILDWDDSAEADVVGYEVYDLRTGFPVLQTQQSFAVLPQLDVDTVHQFVVHAIDQDGLLSEASEPVVMHLDDLNLVFVQPGGPQPVPYKLPLRSSPDGPDLVMHLPGVQSPGTLRIASSLGVPEQPLPGELGHYPYTFRMVCGAGLAQGPIGLDLRYDEGLIPGGEADLRMLALLGGQWVDVTQALEPQNDMIAGVIPYPTTVAIVGAPSVGQSVCGPAVANSTGGGAVIVASGSTLAVEEWLTLTASSLPPHQFGFFLGSQTEVTTPNIVGSQGTLCLGGSIVRFAGQIVGSGADGRFSIDVDTSAIPSFPVSAITAGQTWTFQAWFRDLNPLATSNFTDAVRVIYD